MSETIKSKRSKIPLILFAVFALPVIMAKLALDNNWFNRASTNKGELLSPPLDVSTLTKQDEPKWQLLYLLPAKCDQTCENSLYSVNQTWMALGKHMDRVDPIILTTEQSDTIKLAELNSHPSLQLLKSDQQSVNKVFKDISTDGIFLVDTLGNLILRYPLYAEKQQAVLHSRDILADMRKLLKLSRIG